MEDNVRMPKEVILQEVVGDAKIIFDIGAKCGESTMKYLDLFPKATIYAFEPAPDNYAGLLAATNRHSRVVAANYAMLDRPGKVDLNLYSHAGSHSVLQLDEWDEAMLLETITVTAMSVDKFCNILDIERVDLLKVDTEGTDLAVLKGASGMLSGGGVCAIYVELMYYPYFKGQCRPEDIIEFLGGFGMQAVAIYPIFKDDEMRYANAVFTHG